ncbi:unnamed protein product [Rotaria socialis]|uniref:Uncharacterized protein n=1 Tax=Rotaria socialis TaxID=392032 RepID=A0A820NT01_9BILA|nr:unnamed protein product [Rotaria socialis]CAF3403180.1 unnamed protein product [Rotaria socialis]CAF3408492.1 unnamed protein product [Rotaria socialis]CAF3542049.1 unnamed protein product [Rotaria socialis]CAF4235578.1 unnamed protein product [Rotaria socialis]
MRSSIIIILLALIVVVISVPIKTDNKKAEKPSKRPPAPPPSPPSSPNGSSSHPPRSTVTGTLPDDSHERGPRTKGSTSVGTPPSSTSTLAAIV